MTAKELIQLLQKVGEDTDILIPGYEGGYRDIHEVTIPPIPMTKNPVQAWYEGKWVKARRSTKQYAVVIE